MPLFRPGKPKWRLSLTGDHTFAAGARAITWDQADLEEPAGIWDGVTGITVDRAGTYLIAMRAGCSTVATSTPPGLGLRVNGVTVAHTTQTSTALVTAVQLVELFPLQSGDFVEAYFQRSATNSSTLRQQDSMFAGERCGPVRWTG